MTLSLTPDDLAKIIQDEIGPALRRKIEAEAANIGTGFCSMYYLNRDTFIGASVRDQMVEAAYEYQMVVQAKAIVKEAVKVAAKQVTAMTATPGEANERRQSP